MQKKNLHFEELISVTQDKKWGIKPV